MRLELCCETASDLFITVGVFSAYTLSARLSARIKTAVQKSEATTARTVYANFAAISAAFAASAFIAFSLVREPKLKRTAPSRTDVLTFIACKTALPPLCCLLCEEQALPVETQNPSASRARSITCPGMFLKDACTIHGEYSFSCRASSRASGIIVQPAMSESLCMKFFVNFFCDSNRTRAFSFVSEIQ